MNKFFLALAVASSLGVSAQQISQTQGYNYTVFDSYSKLPMNGKAMAATQAKMVESLPGFHTTTDKLTGMVRDIYGKAMQVPGKDIDEKSNYVINNILGKFGVEASEWQKTNNVMAEHASYNHYEQYIAAHKVAFSQMSLRFTPDGKLQRIVLKHYGAPQPGTVPAISNTAAYNTKAMLESTTGFAVNEKNIDADWEWFPIPSANAYVLHPAWHFTVTGHDDKTNLPVELTGYIDAITGELLYRMNDVKEEVNLVVKGSVYKNGFLVPATIEPLANLEVTIGSAAAANTDDTGFIKNTTLNPSQAAIVKLKGKWSTVRNVTGSGTNPSFNTSIAANGTTYTFPNTAPSSDAAVNAYYHINRMHDYMRSCYPLSTGFTGLDNSLTTIVEVASATGCNASYGGSAINFLAENSSCNSFAKIADIVYHEYGHGINSKFYSFIKGSGGMSNGGLNEGYADVWAMSVTQDPVLGKGAFKSGGNIRTYGPTGTAKVYPMNRTSEVHANGEIIAGAWWDLGVNIGNTDSMAALFARSMYDIPDGPEGTEGEVFHEALISAIVNDDDDANLANGTPHFNAIVAAFAKHGIYLFSDATLTHNEVNHQLAENQEVNVDAEIKVTDPAYFNTIKLVYHNTTNVAWDTLTMTNAGAGSNGATKFTAKIPGQTSGSLIEYYFVTIDINNNNAYAFPTGYNPNLGQSDITLPYQFAIGLFKREATYFQEAPLGWTIAGVPGDAATGGLWVIDAPIPSYWKPNSTLSFMQQTDQDHTGGGGKCLITGNATASTSSDGTADVDGGKTTVLSAIYDISSYKAPVIEYYRWFSNEWGPRDSNPRTDSWIVQIRDGSVPFWQTIENTSQSDVAWRRKLIKVRDYISTGTQFQMRFVAADNTQTLLTGNGQNTVEAALDDFSIYDAWSTSVTQTSGASFINVFPNPADDVINIRLSNAVNGTLSVLDMTGRQLMQQSVGNNISTYSFNTTNLAGGIYMITLATDKTVETTKITVTH
jgi:hypothetical protein